MKLDKIKTYEQGISELEKLERNGGIRRDEKDRIIPVSKNAEHIFAKTKDLAPNGRRWEKLSPEGAWAETAAIRDSESSLMIVDIRPRRSRRY